MVAQAQNTFLHRDEAQNSENLSYPWWQDSVLHVSGDHDYYPHEFINDSGEPDGFTVDIVKEVADIMKLNVVIHLKPWSEARANIENGKIDIITGMFKSAERDRKVDFSIPHFNSSFSVFARNDSEINSIKDLDDKIILVQEGDLAHDYALKNSVGKEIITYPNLGDLLVHLSEGVGDCAIHGRLQGVHFLANSDIENVHDVGFSVVQHQYCMAVTEGNHELLAILNEGLSIIKTNGTYDKIYEKWFGVYEEQSFSWRDALSYFLIIILPLLAIVLASLVWSYMLKKQIIKKTKDLNLELQKRREIQSELERSQVQLTQQNIQLREKNEQIVLINKNLIKAKAKAEENDNLKTAFLANMSHEIRTPMNSIIGFCELLEFDEDETQKKTYSGIISQSAQRLLHLLNDIMDISKIESGQIGIIKKQTNLQPMLNELKTHYQLQARIKGLDFLFVSDALHEPLWINTDEKRISQVLTNYLSNALKHTTSGVIEMGYKVQDRRVRFWVKDTGSGIPADELDHVFERFYQGKNNRSGGTGLGLAISKRIAEHMDCEIGADSFQGKGSTFWFSHPFDFEEVN